MNPLRLLDMPLEYAVAGWTGEYKVKGNIDQADCVVGLSFGYRGPLGKVSPGLSNQDLAYVAGKHYGKLPKILQFEIADAYVESGFKNATKIIRIEKHRQKGKYLDTYEVLAQALEQMQAHGWKTALLLAHPYHMPRVQLVCDRLGLKWVATADLEGAVEFDPLSTQKWTTGLDKWRGYEPLALTFYRLKGYA